MAENIEKLEAKIKALQAKKREINKKEKAKREKEELARLKAVEKEYILLHENAQKNEAKLKNYDAIMEQAKMLGWGAKELHEVLKKQVSTNNQGQNN